MGRPPRHKNITPGWMTAEANKTLADLNHDDKDTMIVVAAVMGEMGYDVAIREQSTNFVPQEYGPMMLQGMNIVAGCALGRILQTVHTATLSDEHFTKDIEDDTERLEAIRNLYEQAIPGRMPKGVVDIFELVEINKQQRAVCCSHDGVLQEGREMVSIRQTGQTVVVGQPREGFVALIQGMYCPIERASNDANLLMP